MPISDKALEIAKQQIGIEEQPKGSNWGPDVSEYIKRAGYNGPVFWCMCFVYWVIDEAKAQGTQNPLPRTGSCDVVLNWARKGGHLQKVPKPGDIFLVMASENDAIHTGFVTAVNGAQVETIEGNSNNDGSVNGYAVVERKRSVAKLRFVRWAGADKKKMLRIGGQDVAEMPVIGGISYAPVRLVADKLGLDSNQVIWDADVPGVRFGKDLFPATPLVIEERAYIPVRVLAGFFGLECKVDDAGEKVDLVRL